ncbi:MAG: GHKL domain-containing protein [Lachnospiraceae bacterium]|nr:GHKL domain-containing protein [Lachnospiraceae bacterium]
MNDMVLVYFEFGLYMVFLLIGATALFGGKIRHIWPVVINYIGFACITMSGNWEVDFVGFIGGISLIVCYMLTVRFSSEHRYIKKICVLLILMYLQELFEMILSAITFPLTKEIAEREWAVIQCLWEVSVLFIISWLYLRHKDKLSEVQLKKRAGKGIIPLFIFVASEIVMLVVWLKVSLEDSPNARSYFFGSFLNLCSLISIGMMVIIVIYIKSTNDQLESAIAVEQKLQQLQVEYYETLLEKENATRKYRHDMNNHLICLKGLLDNEDMEGTKAYIDEMNTNMQAVKKKSYHTGLSILDMIMNYHVGQLEQGNPVEVKGRCNSPLAVSDMDLCVIFANLIQNAVEALNRCDKEKGFLKLGINEGSNYVQIRIVNSVLPHTIQLDEKGNLQTTKKDKRSHGIGVSNVKETINRVGGKLQYHIEEEEFVCEIILPIQSN